MAADASILIHLDFLSIYGKSSLIVVVTTSFNPYSPGFSIYLNEKESDKLQYFGLQSLFTWIFYLFIVTKERWLLKIGCFNPYSPGFSIYLVKENILLSTTTASILIHLDFLSISTSMTS